MTEATCKREIELEIPADNVQKATDKVARDIARMARIPGFRPGKAPVTLVRRRFAEDIQGEVVQSLVPEYLEKALDEKKLIPVTRPAIDNVEFKEGEPLKFRAVFEVLPEFELGDYKNLQVQSMKFRSATSKSTRRSKKCASARPLTFRSKDAPAKDGDYVLIKLDGNSRGRRRSGAGGKHSVPLGRRRNARELHRKSSRRKARRHETIRIALSRRLSRSESWPERPTTIP